MILLFFAIVTFVNLGGSSLYLYAHLTRLFMKHVVIRRCFLGLGDGALARFLFSQESLINTEARNRSRGSSRIEWFELRDIEL